MTTEATQNSVTEIEEPGFVCENAAGGHRYCGSLCANCKTDISTYGSCDDAGEGWYCPSQCDECKEFLRAGGPCADAVHPQLICDGADCERCTCRRGAPTVGGQDQEAHDDNGNTPAEADTAAPADAGPHTAADAHANPEQVQDDGEDGEAKRAVQPVTPGKAARPNLQRNILAVPQKGELKLLLLHPGAIIRVVHWVGPEKIRQVYACAGDGCADCDPEKDILCHRHQCALCSAHRGRDGTLFGKPVTTYSMWVAHVFVRSGRTIRDPGLFRPSTAAWADLCDIAEEEGGAEELTGRTVQLVRVPRDNGAGDRIVLTLTNDPRVEDGLIERLRRRGPDYSEMHAEMCRDYPSDTDELIRIVLERAAQDGGDTDGY